MLPPGVEDSEAGHEVQADLVRAEPAHVLEYVIKLHDGP